MTLKSNRTVALSLEDKHQGHVVRMDAPPLEDNTARLVFTTGLSSR